MPQRRYSRTVVPDRVDLRDRPYQPSVAGAPPRELNSLKENKLPPLNQEQTNACTGFALAQVIHLLLNRALRKTDVPVSPFMLYSMARRYDEFPGYTADEGSSLRGAMKGWYRHGACAQALFPTLDQPPTNSKPSLDWWQDGARRPLGAYYRVSCESVVDMQLALRDTGVLYASAVCHGGWDEGSDLSPAESKGWMIPQRVVQPSDGGHAFAIVGYSRSGFLVLNSWGEEWGDHGLGILTYADWLDNAMDCWVAQLGVVTSMHEAVANAPSLRVSKDNKVELATGSLRNQEIAPFVVDMENNGKLSSSGAFRTDENDLKALVTHHLGAFRRQWGFGANQPIDVAIYAHGGLTGERAAAETAARWIPALYEKRVFPIFLMWETDLWSTVKSRLEDKLAELLAPEARPTAGVRALLERLWNQRVERALAGPGSVVWNEMKDNAEAISREGSGAQLLYKIGREAGAFTPEKVRLHLIGHSAGAILHCHAVQALAQNGWRFESVSFMAPAARVELFNKTIGPEIGKGTIGRYEQWHLQEGVEEKDPTCRPIAGYGRSLLYLLSHSFEKGKEVPILGLERDYRSRVYPKDTDRTHAHVAPGPRSASTTHGGFDDDKLTMESVIHLTTQAPRLRPVAIATPTLAGEVLVPPMVAPGRPTRDRRGARRPPKN